MNDEFYFLCHSLYIKCHFLGFMFSQDMSFHHCTFHTFEVADLTFPIKFSSKNNSRCHTKIVFWCFLILVGICIIPRCNLYDLRCHLEDEWMLNSTKLLAMMKLVHFLFIIRFLFKWQFQNEIISAVKCGG